MVDVGFKVGKSSSVKYIVLQLHYRMPISGKLVTLLVYIGLSCCHAEHSIATAQQIIILHAINIILFIM